MVVNSQTAKTDNNVGKLTQRQQQCLELAGEGMSSKEIGRALGISPSTVDNHIQAASDKLNARNRTDAVRILRTTAPIDKQESPSSPSLFSLPPIGGQKNNLPASHRLIHIVQIAVFAIIGVSAAILTIAGVVHVLAGPE